MMSSSDEQRLPTQPGNPEDPPTDRLQTFMKTMQDGVQKALEKINQRVDENTQLKK